MLLNLGREDRLDPDRQRGLVRSINRYLGEPDFEPGGPRPAPRPDGGGGASRPVWAAWLLDALWRQLEIDTALRGIVGGRRFTTDVERVV